MAQKKNNSTIEYIDKNDLEYIQNKIVEHGEAETIAKKHIISIIIYLVQKNNQFPNQTSFEDIINNINTFLRNNEFENTLEFFLSLLVASFQNYDLEIDDQIDLFTQTISEGYLIYIEQCLWKVADPIFIKQLKIKLLSLVNYQKTLNQHQLNLLIDRHNEIIANSKIISQNKIFLKTKIFSSKFIKQKIYNIWANKIIHKSFKTHKTNITSIRKLFSFNIFSKKITQENNCHQTKKNDLNREFIMNALYSHNPKNKILIPDIIANNKALANESKRLHDQGISKENAATKAEKYISRQLKKSYHHNR